MEVFMRIQSMLLILAISIGSLISCGGGGGDTNPASPTYPSGKPTGLTVETASNSVTIHWNQVPGAVAYFVYMSETGVQFTKYDSQEIKTTSFQVFNLINGSTYYFGVSAVGNTGWESSIAYVGGYPKAVPVIPGFTGPGPDPLEGPPEPPRNLQGVPMDAAVEFHWEASVSGDVTGYRIYRIFEGIPEFTVIRDDYPDLSLVDSDLANTVAYSYYITALDSEGFESEKSNVITLTPLDFIPSIVTGLMNILNPGRIIVEWNVNPELDVVLYSIERVEESEIFPGGELIIRYMIAIPTSSDPLNPNDIIPGLIAAYLDVSRDKIVLIDKAIIIGTGYTYRIAAIDLAGQEGPAAETITGATF